MSLLKRIDQLRVNEKNDTDWVLVDTAKRKVLKRSKGKPKFTSSRNQELMTVAYAKKKGYITESKISATAKRTLLGLIKNPNKGTVNIDNMKVMTKPTGNGIVFTLPADDFEISMALTDIADTLGYSTNHKTTKQHMTFEVRPK